MSPHIHGQCHECSITMLHTEKQNGLKKTNKRLHFKETLAIHPIVLRLLPPETHGPQAFAEFQLFLLETKMSALQTLKAVLASQLLDGVPVSSSYLTLFLSFELF